MRILLANDDGLGAPGLRFLESVARQLGDDIWVVAPDGKRTAASGSLTIGSPLTITRQDARHFAHSGTPADSVVIAMTWLLAGKPQPDLVLAGVNDGRNVAEDVIYSGTLGIAREAACWGIPAIGISRVKRASVAAGDAPWLASLLRAVLDQREQLLANGDYLSLNLPRALPAPLAAPGIGRDKIARRAEELHRSGDSIQIVIPRGRPHTATDGDENTALAAGHATLTRLRWHARQEIAATTLRAFAPVGGR